MPEEQHETEPYLLMAILCQRADQDQYGSFNIINVLELLAVGTDDPNAPEEFPGFRLEGQVVISMASGDVVGDREVKIWPLDPDENRLDPVTQSVRFHGADHRVTIVSNMTLDVQHTGVYWFDIYLDEKELTRIPLRIRYERAARRPPITIAPN